MKNYSTTDTLRASVVEQLMRVTSDDAIILPFLSASPGTREAHVALGRLLSATPVRLVVGSPLMAFVSGCDLDVNWRLTFPAESDSLWSSYEFLNSLYGPVVPAATPYEDLEFLRSLAGDDLNFPGA